MPTVLSSNLLNLSDESAHKNIALQELSNTLSSLLNNERVKAFTLTLSMALG
jgi:hypothetical protein